MVSTAFGIGKMKTISSFKSQLVLKVLTNITMEQHNWRTESIVLIELKEMLGCLQFLIAYLIPTELIYFWVNYLPINTVVFPCLWRVLVIQVFKGCFVFNGRMSVEISQQEWMNDHDEWRNFFNFLYYYLILYYVYLSYYSSRILFAPHTNNPKLQKLKF